jgi:hypothetical protein
MAQVIDAEGQHRKKKKRKREEEHQEFLPDEEASRLSKDLAVLNASLAYRWGIEQRSNFSRVVQANAIE